MTKVLTICLLLYSLYVVVAHVDPATRHKTKIRQKDGKKLHLVMSDEFKKDNREFGRGKDPIFEAVQKPDNSNEAIQFYNSSSEYVTTEDDHLVITARVHKTSWLDWDYKKKKPIVYTKNYTSAMIQTWNKFCFTGGVLELSIDLPGDAYSGGLWPAAWLNGNLARVTYDKSTMHMWPWSYDRCGEIDHLETKQEINACLPDPGHGLHPHQGRGAPEIDIFEVMPGHNMPGHNGYVEPFMSNSLQIAPGVPKGNRRPRNGERLHGDQSWYSDLTIGNTSDYNYWFWGQECGPEIDKTTQKIHKYMEDAVSVNTLLNETHFNSQHVYKIEWQPGPNGYLYWYLDNVVVFGIEGTSLQHLTGSMIPVEPMYLILNIAISHRWGMPEPCPVESCPMCWHCYDCLNPDCQCALPDGMKECKNFPASMKIDYIRLYQDKEDPLHTLGCSPADYPTAEFIASHAERYEDWKPYNIEDYESYRFYRIIKWIITVIIAVCILLGIGVSIRTWRKVATNNQSPQQALYMTIPDVEEKEGEDSNLLR